MFLLLNNNDIMLSVIYTLANDYTIFIAINTP